MRGQAAAIGLVMACGVATFVMALSMLDSLTGTLDAYYEDHRFADIFAHLKRSPQPLAARIAEVPGVAYVQTRVVERITLEMPNLPEPASGQVISLPELPREGLNLLHVRTGRFPRDARSREVLVSQRFAQAHGLRTGDGVTAVLNGRRETLRVVGIALSPEFVYLISPGSILPENRRFGVFWMARDEMDAAFDMEGAFNDILIALTPEASEAEVIDRVDSLTDRYGGLGAHGREDQPSHKFVANEIRELRGMTLIVPIIFLGVAAFLLNIVLSRMITTQREQIAALKALGYTHAEIGLHYFSFVMLIVLLAGIAGCTSGGWMGRGLTALYSDFFDFPSFEYSLRLRVMVLGFLVSAAAATIGVLHALVDVMRLPPAEAMRPQAPPAFRPTLMERIGVHRAVPSSVRMILRQLERRPVKTGLSILGIGLATAILVVGSFTQDAIEYLLDFQFNRVKRYDIDVVMTDRLDDTALSSIRNMPGVRSIEPSRSLSVRIRSGHRSRRIGIVGLAQHDGLYRLADMNGASIRLPERGVVLSTVLADILKVSVGDRVSMEALEGRRTTFSTQVTGVIEDFSGLSAYMRMDEVNRLMWEQNTIGSVFVAIDPQRADLLYQELREAPHVAAVNVKAATVENFRQTIARNLGLMRAFLIGFSVVIAFGVVYNSARISLSERSRDLATLRVVGFTRGEISRIQLGELAIVTALAIPLGLGIGSVLAWATSQSIDSELIRIPFVIAPSTFALAAIVVTIASIVSGLVVLRRIGTLDLVAVLKARE